MSNHLHQSIYVLRLPAMLLVRSRTAETLAFLSLTFCCASAARADTFGSGDNQFTIDFVTIGNPVNPADGTGNPHPAGSVGYVYRMGKFEASRDMVTKADAQGNLGITLQDMSFVIGGTRPEMPAIGISWNEAARFVNWLNTSEGFSPAYKFSRQPGDVGYNANTNISLWIPGDPGYDATNRYRNSLAHYFLPSVHEWYKAAYYDPNASAGVGGYWNYPTASNSAPMAVPSGTDPGTAVYGQSWNQGPADITQAGGLSPYGVAGLGGNVWEWEETESDLVNNNPSAYRSFRGGLWVSPSSFLSASNRENGAIPTLGPNIGFRVASIVTLQIAADFDNDGDVDGADFLHWQLNDGSELDLADWQENFGNDTSPMTAASTGVPEPTTGLLLLIGMMAMLFRRNAAVSYPHLL